MRQEYINELELIEFISNTRKHHMVDDVTEGFETSQLAFFIAIFSFFASDPGKKLLMMKSLIDHLPLQVYLFPVAGVLEMGEAFASLYDLIQSDNKNLNKTLEFSRKVVKASIINVAIGIGVYATVTGAVALGVVVPYLFVAALALNTLYSLVAVAYHAVRMSKAENGSLLYQSHQQELVKHVVRSIAGIVLTGAIVALLVLGVSTPIGLAVVSTIAVITLIGVFAVGRVMKHRAAKGAELARERRLKNRTEGKQEARFNVLFKENASNDAVEQATRAQGDVKDRMYVRNLSRVLNAAKREGHGALKNAFINIINAKIRTLENEIQNAPKRHRLFSEEPKRRAKINALKELREKIKGNEEGKYFERSEIDDIAAKYKDVFQSFFHDKSDVALIFDAAKEYFAYILIENYFDPKVKSGIF